MKAELRILAKYVIVILLLSLSSFSFADDYDDFLAQSDKELAELTKQMQFDIEESVTEVVEERTTYKLYYGGWSKHLNESDYDRNENNQLVAFEYRSWVVGTFVNSFYDRTWMAGYNFNYAWDKLEVGIIGGVSYGYDEEDADESKYAISYKGWSPVGFLYISYPVYNSDSLEIRTVMGSLGSALTLVAQFTY